MRTIPTKMREEMSNDPYYRVCSRLDLNCDGRITFEHAVIFAGRQLNEKWAILPLCEFHHAVNKHQDGGMLNKEINMWICLNRATEEELSKVSKAVNYKGMRDRLNKVYGNKKLEN